MRAVCGLALWAILVASFLFLGFERDRISHRRAAFNYLRARNATVEAAEVEPGWISLAPLLGKEIRVDSIRFIEEAAVDADLVQVAAFEELAVLGLAESEITNEAAKHLSQLKNLTSLDLRNTRFGDAGVTQLRAASLQSLDLSETPVTDGGIATISQWSGLRIVKLRSVTAFDGAFAQLSQLPKLRELDLSFTDAGEATLAALGDHPRLSILHLNGCPILDEHLEPLAECPALECLSLEETGVGDVGVSRLANCPALVRLFLNRTRVTDRALQALRPMSNLIQVEAKQTEVSPAALEQFHGRHGKARKPIPTAESGASLIQIPWNVCEIR